MRTNNMTDLFKSLKNLREIVPNADFANHSRMAILSTSKRSRYQAVLGNQFKQIFTLGLAMSMAAVLFVVLSNVSKLPLNGFSPDIIASLNGKDLAQEKKDIDFNIHLAEAKYYKESTQQITMAIDAAFNPNSTLLDTDSIKKQASNLDSLVKELTL